MQYCRMIDKKVVPTDEDIINYLGPSASRAWNLITSYIDENYDIIPECVYGGANYGWCIRYRKSGKSLCTLYPENGAFTALIVLGKKEADKAYARINEFSQNISQLLRCTEQLHDGKWLWIRVLTVDDVDDIKNLLHIKRKPKKMMK